MFQLPKLQYSYDALEPYIDAKTMEIHYSKHHNGYVNNLNNLLEKYPQWQDKTLESLLKNLGDLPEDIRMGVKNNGGGHYNHSLFWEIMGPGGGGEPQSFLREAITKNFGSFENFKELFTKTAVSHFGSGWGWLSLDKGKKLIIHSTSNQDTPISQGLTPIICVDVWEHAYYLKYQNRRQEYIENWWNVLNWSKIEENYKLLI